MTEHNRREGYWRFYDHVVAEVPRLRRALIRLVLEKPCPRWNGGNRGRPPVYFKKHDFACLWMVMADNQTYRQTESDMGEDAHPMGRRACARPHRPSRAHA